MTFSLHNGNCLEIMKDLKDNSIDLMFCDLPYGQTSCKWDSLIDLDLFWKQVNRICKINCPMFFTCTTKFGVNLINSNPKNFRYDMVWVKSSSCGFLNAKKMPMRKHESIYVFYRKLPFYDLSSHKSKFTKENKEDLVRDTSNYKNDGELYGDVERTDYMRKKNESVYDPPLPNSIIQEKKEVYNLPTSHVSNWQGEARKGTIYEPELPTSILEINSQKGKHATQKPIALMSWCIKYYSKEGDTILDPTMGSGSTGLSCKELKRNFVGIELDENIFNLARERMEQN
tara:strand:- start:1858 stop:2715 length:858 start_codon:yes stop_codon:yes gene_type:complete